MDGYNAARREPNRERLAARRKNPKYRDADLARLAARREAMPHEAWEHSYRARAHRYGFEPIVESFTRDELIEAYGAHCWHCTAGAFEELDHYPVPVSRGGAHRLDNVRPSCLKCNRASWRDTPAPIAEEPPALARTGEAIDRAGLALAV
ncbi:HNH endonuclease [Flexivirga sp. B27]